MYDYGIITFSLFWDDVQIIFDRLMPVENIKAAVVNYKATELSPCIRGDTSVLYRMLHCSEQFHCLRISQLLTIKVLQLNE